MKYKAVNELESFDFKDAVIQELVWQPEELLMFTLEAVIVKPENSQNSNYTYSYAGDLQMRFFGAVIQKAVKEGYKYYDANDNLLEEQPDIPLSEEEISDLLKHLGGAYMWNMTPVDKRQNDTGHFLYLMGIDMGDEEETTYWFQLEFTEVNMEWEKYMNRVEMN